MSTEHAPNKASPQPVRFGTRFLFPFLLEQKPRAAIISALRDATVAGFPALWKLEAPRHHYRDELADTVQEFLFGVDANESCGYLRADPVQSRRWFQGAVANLNDKSRALVRLDPRCGIELFVTEFGVGVLSFSFELHGPSADLLEILDFNYHLSQLARHKTLQTRIRLPHPMEDPDTWSKIPADKKALLEAETAPADDAPLVERMGKRGGSFTLQELADELLSPLRSLQLHATQRILSVYTVVRFGAELDLADVTGRTYAELTASGLAQVEERTHAGDVLGAGRVPARMLNRRHWAAVSLHGAAHLVADQQSGWGDHGDNKGVEFNEERQHRTAEKYFIPYLVALLQRLALKRYAKEANALISMSASEDSELGLIRLRQGILEFSARGHLPEVSQRSALHDYYRLCQEGLDIERNLAQVRATVEGLDAFYTVRRQEEMSRTQAGILERTNETLRSSHKMHAAIEWVEIFLVSVYAAHLWEMFSPDGSLAHGHWGVLTAAAIGGVGALMVLRPWKHRH